MRKRKIIEQNALLFEQIEKLKKQITDLKKELSVSTAEIERLKEENAAREATPTAASTPIEKIEEKVLHAAPQVSPAEYGAKAIGKIVVYASRITSSLTGDSGTDKIELVNLILGKAEVSKGEILEVVSGSKPDNEKKMAIDGIVSATCDYFEKAAQGK